MIKKRNLVWILLLCLSCCLGCSEPEKEKPAAVMIKTPLISLSEPDFLEELDLKKSAYPYAIDKDPAEYNGMVIQLVNMLSEEMILLSAAGDLGVTVTETEVNAAEAEIKADYPENTFDEMLLKNAISYSLWKKRLKKNLIIDKLLDREIRHKVEITSEDLVEFYRKYNMEDPRDLKKKNKEPQKIIDENELVSILRMQKTEDAYEAWLKELELKYPVEINKEALKPLLIDIDEKEENNNEKTD
nr:hypothetical protein [Desulfobacula sp.]